METLTHITKEIYILSPLSLYWHADHLPALCRFLFLVEGGGQVVEVALMIISHLFTMNSCTKLCNIILNMHKPLLSSDEKCNFIFMNASGFTQNFFKAFKKWCETIVAVWYCTDQPIIVMRPLRYIFSYFPYTLEIFGNLWWLI